MDIMDIFVIIPVYNEQESLPGLFKQLVPAIDNLKRECEIIFVNDGSWDASLPLLLQEFKKRLDIIKILDLNGNFGQHAAIMAGFQATQGEIIITMDADLQNLPEEIPKIIAYMGKGHDVVRTIRENRKDSVGEYIGRIYQEVRKRPHFIVRKFYQKN